MRARVGVVLLVLGLVIGAGGALGYVYLAPGGAGTALAAARIDLAAAIESNRRVGDYLGRALRDSGRLGEAIHGAVGVVESGGTIPNKLRAYADRIGAIGREWDRYLAGLGNVPGPSIPAAPGETP
jgi:hypothetical protein